MIVVRSDLTTQSCHGYDQFYNERRGGRSFPACGPGSYPCLGVAGDVICFFCFGYRWNAFLSVDRGGTKGNRLRLRAIYRWRVFRYGVQAGMVLMFVVWLMAAVTWSIMGGHFSWLGNVQ